MTFRTVLRSELTKLLSLRSTRWTLLALVVTTVGFGTLIAWGSANGYANASPHDQAIFDPTANALAGMAFGQLAIAVLGVLMISGEYGNGAIRGTFTAVPRRGLVVAAKAVLIAVVGLVFGWVSAFAVFFTSHPIYQHYGLAVGLGHAGVLRAVIGGGLYIGASGLFGFATGALLRRTAGAITAAVAGLLVLPGLTALIPGSIGDAVQRYFTSNAGQQIATVVRTGNVLGPWSGYAAYSLWWIVILAVASVLVLRRDA